MSPRRLGGGDAREPAHSLPNPSVRRCLYYHATIDDANCEWLDAMVCRGKQQELSYVFGEIDRLEKMGFCVCRVNFLATEIMRNINGAMVPYKKRSG